MKIPTTHSGGGEFPRSRGFTLVEMVAVLVILALLGSATAISLRVPLSRARMTHAMGDLEAFDARTRTAARRTDQLLVLDLDLNRGVVRRMTGQLQPLGSPPLRLGSAIQIDAIRTQSAVVSDGVVRVRISPLGQSDSYAVRLRPARGEPVWLVVIGATGQTVRFDREHDVDQLFATLSAPGRNAR